MYHLYVKSEYNLYHFITQSILVLLFKLSPLKI